MPNIIFERTRLMKPYIDIKLGTDTLKSVLNSNHQTAYRLYLITNGIKEIQDFASIDSKEYRLVANVKTECGFVGEAKRQIWSVKHLQPLISKRPKYTMRCELTHLMSNKVMYKCTHEHINPDVIYRQIQECINDLKQIIE